MSTNSSRALGFDALGFLNGEDVDVERLDPLGELLGRLRILLVDDSSIGRVRPPLDTFRGQVALDDDLDVG